VEKKHVRGRLVLGLGTGPVRDIERDSRLQESLRHRGSLKEEIVRKLVAMLSFAGVALVALAAVSFASARSTVWSASLTASDVIPKQAVKHTRANGSFSATLSGYELTFKLKFSHLSGAATGASLGYGAKGKAGRITVSLCAPCQSPVATGVGLDRSLIKALKQHLVFVVVKTAKNPNGEIRGQVL
jgi:hypothetical protein